MLKNVYSRENAINLIGFRFYLLKGSRSKVPEKKTVDNSVSDIMKNVNMKINVLVACSNR